MFRSIAVVMALCFATVTAQAAPLSYEFSVLYGRTYAAGSMACNPHGFLEEVRSSGPASFSASSIKPSTCQTGNVYTSQITAGRGSLSDTGFSMSGSAGATSDGSTPWWSAMLYFPRADGYNYTVFGITETTTIEVTAEWTSETFGDGIYQGGLPEFTNFDIWLWKLADVGYADTTINLLTGLIDDSLDTSTQSGQLTLAPGKYLLRADIAVGTGIRLGSADATYLVSLATVPIPAAVWLFGSALGLMGVMRRKISS